MKKKTRNFIARDLFSSKYRKRVIKPKKGCGGIGGSYIKPTGLSNVWNFYNVFKELNSNIKIIGCGGIANGIDAYEYILCGADLLQIGTQYYKEDIECFARIDSELKNVDTEIDQFDEAIKESVDRLKDLQEQIDRVKHKLSILDAVKFIVSEEGVKSYIVRKLLQLFNSKLAYYLDKMDANCLCIFNEYFEEEIINEKGKVCSYYNFSGAERKNIDLACLFAFMDIRRLQGSAVYNFSIYDELLDTSLDEKGVDLVLDILRERVDRYNECVMVISHRKESVKIGSHYKNPGDIIFLEKKNGFTRRVDFIEQ